MKTEFYLGMAAPEADDATSFMRAWGPLGQMAKQDRRLKLVQPPRHPNGAHDYNWAWVAGLDAILLQRPWNKQQGQLLVLANMLGIPVWIDWDDDLATVRPSNPRYHLYAEPDLAKRLDWMVSLAQAVTVTTGELAERRSAGTGASTGKVRVLPNAQMWPASNEPRTRRVVWRGGGNHEEDVLSVLDQIEAVARMPQFSKWEWHFLGEPPWQVRERLEFLGGDRLSVGFWADPFTYMRTLHGLAPWCVIVPMVDNAFNRCRSNLPILEATSAGAVAVAKDLPEYVKAGARCYDRADMFGEVLADEMGQFINEAVNPAVVTARRLQEEYELESLNEQRWDILRELGFPTTISLGCRPVAANGAGAALGGPGDAVGGTPGA